MKWLGVYGQGRITSSNLPVRRNYRDRSPLNMQETVLCRSEPIRELFYLRGDVPNSTVHDNLASQGLGCSDTLINHLRKEVKRRGYMPPTPPPQHPKKKKAA